MSKVYVLAICLLAASFTGCLADDKTTDEKIEPVNGADDASMNSSSNDTADKNKNEFSNITIRYNYNENYLANFSKNGSTVQVTFNEIFTSFFWFIDYDGNEIRHNLLQGGFDNCHSNGNWSVWDSNGSADCHTQFAIDPESVIWEFNLARTPMSVAIGFHEGYYFLESF